MIIGLESDYFSYKGKRENNEDCVFPNPDIPSELNNLFLVCDGVGGLDKGEIASDLCCTQFSSYFYKNKIEFSDKEIIDNAVLYVEDKFDSYMVSHPESMGMASTFTLLHFHKYGATIAHMGDSRIYHIRNGVILYKTKDHSLVQELFEQKVISEEEMKTHSQRNQISRAMRGASIKSYKADAYIVNDLKEGDYFFMCTDGVLESFSDDDLQDVFSSNQEVDTINAKIIRKCIELSNDNFSGYTIRIKEIEEQEILNNTLLTEQPVYDKNKIEVEENDFIEQDKIEPKKNKLSNKFIFYLLIIIGILTIFIGLYAINEQKNQSQGVNHHRIMHRHTE